MTKVYELRKGDKFSVSELVNIPHLTFDHMDGAYCYAFTHDGQVCHIHGYQDVLPYGDPSASFRVPFGSWDLENSWYYNDKLELTENEQRQINESHGYEC